MHNVIAAQSINAGEENKTMDPIEQAARTAERVVSEIAEEPASRVKDAASATGDHAVRAGLELMQRNAETVQHALRCFAKLTARMTERSADRLGRAVGVSGESVEEAAQKSSRNLEAIVQSGTVLTQITQCLCEEWVDIAWARMDRGFDRIEAFLRCRTPQDFTALHSELIRDNMETVLGFTREAGEHFARLAGGGRQHFGDVTGSRKAA